MKATYENIKQAVTAALDEIRWSIRADRGQGGWEKVNQRLTSLAGRQGVAMHRTTGAIAYHLFRLLGFRLTAEVVDGVLQFRITRLA